MHGHLNVKYEKLFATLNFIFKKIIGHNFYNNK